MRSRDDAGSVAPMIIGFAVVAMLLVGVVVDSSAAFLARQNLNATADAAALAWRRTLDFFTEHLR